MFVFLSCRPDAPELVSEVIAISTESIPAGEFLRISDIAINSRNEIFVSDEKNSRLVCLSKDGVFLTELGRRNKHSGALNHPSALAIDKDNNLFVSCLGKLAIIDSTHNIINEFRISVTGESPAVNSPDIGFRTRSIAVDSIGYIYIVGYGQNGVVHKHDQNGKLLKSFGETYRHDFPRVRRAYSGGYLVLARERLYLNYITPYRITVHDLDGTFVSQYKRADLDFSPRFEVTPTSSIYRPSSRGFKEHLYQRVGD